MPPGLMQYGISSHCERPEGEKPDYPYALAGLIVSPCRGQKRLFEEVLAPRRPAGEHNMKFLDLDSKGPPRSKVHESLGKVLKLKVRPPI